MFITNAYAQAAGGGTGGDLMPTLIMIGIMFAAFYFLMIRPQSKRQKEHQKMVATLEKGNEVLLAGGILGRIARVGEQQLSIEIAEGVEITVQRNAIVQVLPKGTIK